MKAADVVDGARLGREEGDRKQLREADRRVRLLENEVLRRAAAYLSQANLAGK